MNARVRRKVERLYREFKTRAVAGLAPFRPPDLPAPPPTADRRGPAAAPDPKRPRVDPEPAPEEEESQEISIVGVRTAEERDAEAPRTPSSSRRRNPSRPPTRTTPR